MLVGHFLCLVIQMYKEKLENKGPLIPSCTHHWISVRKMFIIMCATSWNQQAVLRPQGNYFFSSQSVNWWHIHFTTWTWRAKHYCKFLDFWISNEIGMEEVIDKHANKKIPHKLWPTLLFRSVPQLCLTHKHRDSLSLMSKTQCNPRKTFLGGNWWNKPAGDLLWKHCYHL